MGKLFSFAAVFLPAISMAGCTSMTDVKLQDRQDWNIELHPMGNPALVVYLHYDTITEKNCLRIPNLQGTINGKPMELETNGKYVYFAIGHGQGCYQPQFHVSRSDLPSDKTLKIEMTDGTKTLIKVVSDLDKR